jgi:hypothetical protein
MPKSRKRKNRKERSVREGGRGPETTMSVVVIRDADGNPVDVIPHAVWVGGVEDMPASVEADRQRWGLWHEHLGEL